MDKKNSSKLYKAYQLWKTTVQHDSVYSDYVKSLNIPSSGTNSIVGTVGNKLLDLAWVERIEFALPYMDKAIRESRSFIEQKDEIVPIEKVKRVNTQSVRHLAQHTNLIAKVEDNGDVMPEQILNIYYESSFSIYENRFLYTLLGKLVDFVEKRYQALKNKDEKIDVKYKIDKVVKRRNKVSKMVLNFDYNTSASIKFDLNEDTTNLSGFTRVVRIRSIIHDFYAAPLIKNLAGVETVKPPIIHTNLMSKNVNFRTCLELWDYIERYKGLGFSYENEVFDGKMPNKIRNDLQDIFVFGNFLTEITFNTEYKRGLQRRYREDIKAEVQKAKEAYLLAEQKKKQATEAIINQKVTEVTSTYEKKLSDLNNKIVQRKEEHKKQLSDQKAKYSENIAKLKQKNADWQQKYKELLQGQLLIARNFKKEKEAMHQQLKSFVGTMFAKNNPQKDENEPANIDENKTVNKNESIHANKNKHKAAKKVVKNTAKKAVNKDENKE